MWPLGGLRVSKDIKYEMTVDDADGSYSLSLDFDLPKSWYMKAIGSLMKRANNQPQVLDEWEVSEPRFKDMVLKRLGGTIDKVSRDFGQDFKEFKIISTQANKIKFMTIGDRVHTHLELAGVCICRK